MIDMEVDITGLIESSELGKTGHITFGFIGVKTDKLKRIKVKVTARTDYDTLSVGERVHIRGVLFSNSYRYQLVAREISKLR